MMLRSVVVLPAPLRPTSPTVAPVSTARLSPRRMVTALIVTVMPSMRSTLSLSENGAANLRPCQNVGGRTIGNDFSVIKCHCPLCVALHNLQIVLHEDRGDTALLERRHQRVHDGKLVARTHTASWLVHQQYLRLENDRQRHVEHLASALRQVRHGSRRLIAQPELRQTFVGRGHALATVHRHPEKRPSTGMRRARNQDDA